MLAPPVAAFEPVATIAGKASVRDGDGILFGKVEIRLQGIAAPEDGPGKRQPGGAESTASLRRLVDGAMLVCRLDGTTAGKGNRPVGICYLGSLDIGLHQVRNGHARDCPHFSGGRYAEAEREAQADGKNLAAIYPLPPYCRD
ncbi:MAG: thermonuclease family protein [Nitratireductor sp.]|nr:thermonuclease family protein [Nitratireductor sp.]